MPKTLPYIKTYQLNHKSSQNQEKPHKTKTAQGDGRQDKRANITARILSAQPARSVIPQRAQPLDTKPHRSQNPTVDNRRTVQLTMWVKPIVKAEIQRLVDQGQAQGPDELTMSSVGAALLEKAVQGHIDMQYGALLGPIIEAAIDRRLKTQENRLALLLVRACLAVEQTRILATNILGRQPNVSPEVLNDILDHTLTEARKKITRRSPELEALIQEVKSWLSEKEKKP